MNASAAMALKSNPHSRCPVQKCAHNSVGVFNLHSDCSTWMDKCDAIFHCVYTCVQLAFFKVKPLIGRHLSQKPFQCVHDIFFIFLCLLKYTNKPNGVADYLQAIQKPIIWKANGKKMQWIKNELVCGLERVILRKWARNFCLLWIWFSFLRKWQHTLISFLRPFDGIITININLFILKITCCFLMIKYS